MMVGVIGEAVHGLVRRLIRRKRVDSENVKREDHTQLSKSLSAPDLVAIGVGATIGAGVYILVGTVAREESGPALAVSFVIAGIAAALSAFCYAELACRCPSAGSAYHYTYICLGEGVAWLVGWALILEWTIGGSTIARGITPNLALYFGGGGNVPALLARYAIPGTGILVDPPAAVLILLVTSLLCIGIRESAMAQAIVTSVNVCALIFIIIVGGYLGFTEGWTGYELKEGYFPFGVNGMFAGSAVVFFSYIGFDSITSTAEEVKSPQRDLPIGIGLALLICSALYMLVSVVVVGLVPYYALDPDTPISSAFASYGAHWAAYIITTGAVTALCASLLGSLLPQPRILMEMARDGLLPQCFSDISKHTQVPVKGTIITGIFAAALAFFMDVSELAGLVSLGTLFAFTTVAVSVLILRYVPPNEVPLSLKGLTDSALLQFESRYSQEISSCSFEHLKEGNVGLAYPLIEKGISQGEQTEQKRRKIAAWAIDFVCVGVLILASAASAEYLSSIPRFILCGLGGALLVCSLTVLACINQDDARHSFGHKGGFDCPFVPFLPVACILINTYLLINLGANTWIRALVWFGIGILIYASYSHSHSSLKNAVYVRAAYADKVHASSSHHQA